MAHDPSDDPTPQPSTEAADASPEAESESAPPSRPDPSGVDAAADPAMEPLPLRGTARPEPLARREGRDPFAQAQEALARAAAARGAELTPLPPARRHPLEAAQEALEKAQAARQHATRGGAAGLAREARARAQLAELKRGGPVPTASTRGDHHPPSNGGDGPQSTDDDGPPVPRKRTL